ncbi:hypothetical protein EV13_1337 [Prochlorococcus sp. MIT 0702]|nr:hypothetical protein EV13_1337 [Prochlorococcus sp. MIT 0702]
MTLAELELALRLGPHVLHPVSCRLDSIAANACFQLEWHAVRFKACSMLLMTNSFLGLIAAE